MRRDVIQMLRPVREISIESTEVRNPTFEGKGWIGKAAKKLADMASKRGSFGVQRDITHDEVRYESYTVDPRKEILKLIKESQVSLEWVLREQIDLIICGPEQFEWIRRDGQQYSFEAFIELFECNQPRLWGMRVVIVPWMTGVLLMPSSMIKG